MEKLITIRTLVELENLTSYLTDKEFIAVDTETTGVLRESQIIGFSVCADVGIAYYVILSYWDVDKQILVDLETKAVATEFFKSLVGKNLILHNAIFDCSMINANFGVDLMPSVHTDTMIAAHLIDENRSVGLKTLAITMFGEMSTQEQKEMKESVYANGGVLTKERFELYKADAELIAKYGAKDTILTLKLFYVLIPQLFEQGLDKFFYEDESMPLLRGPTYDLNTTGLRIDPDRLLALKSELEANCFEDRTSVYTEISDHVRQEYPGTNKKNTFNVDAPQQLSWLLFEKLGLEFSLLSKEGKAVCKALGLKIPYSNAAKREFKVKCKAAEGQTYNENQGGKPKKIGKWWKYVQCGKDTLAPISKAYAWVEKFMRYKKDTKMLGTYVVGIQNRAVYNVIRPSFLQHGTTSGRYSSKDPNFMNLPREDKRVKACIVARPGNVFVGADMSQLEPRVFASVSQDFRLMQCFESGEDFYSVIGAEVFGKTGHSMVKDDPGSFAKTFPDLRQIAKTIALAATYGTTPYRMGPMLGKSVEEAKSIIDNYFQTFSDVHKFMLDSHQKAMKDGRVENLYGRPRRMPAAKEIPEVYGTTPHNELPYEVRNILNLATNHRVQSTAASIMNRAAIAFWRKCKTLADLVDPKWGQVKIVLQVHDSLAVEGPEELADGMCRELQDAMEHSCILPGVKLVAIPEVSKTIAGLK